MPISQLSQLHSSQHQFKDNLVASRWITAPAVTARAGQQSLKHHHHHHPYCGVLWKVLFITSQWEWEDSTLLFFPMKKEQMFIFQLVVLQLQAAIQLSSWALPITYPVGKQSCACQIVPQFYRTVLFPWCLWISPDNLSTEQCVSDWRVRTVEKQYKQMSWLAFWWCLRSLSGSAEQVYFWWQRTNLKILESVSGMRITLSQMSAVPPSGSPDRWNVVGFIQPATSAACSVCSSALDSGIGHAYRCIHGKCRKALVK